jgi:hypothetical protein
MMIPQLLDEREAAQLLRVKPCTVRNERVRGKLGFTPVGARIFYSIDQINEYLETQKVTACANVSQNRAKSGITGSPKNLTAKGKTMRGAAHGTMQNLDRSVVSALARQTFMRQAQP